MEKHAALLGLSQLQYAQMAREFGLFFGPPHIELVAYVEHLFADTPGLVELRALDLQANRLIDRTFLRDPEKIADWILETDRRFSFSDFVNIYCGVATRRTMKGGNKNNLEAVRAADFV